MQPTESYISQALEEFVTDTQSLLDDSERQQPRNKEEIAYWRKQRNAFVKAQTYYLQGVRLTQTPSGYTVPSASRPGALIHRCTRAGEIWICSCEARSFCWHSALIHGYERGCELEALAEDAAELALHQEMADAADILADAQTTRRDFGRRLSEAQAQLGAA